MPSVKDFEISIESVDGNNHAVPFQEYRTRSRGSVVFTNIEAKDGTRFRIRVKPKFPFPEPKDDILHGNNARYAPGQDEDAMNVEGTRGKRDWVFFCNVFMDGSQKMEDNARIDIDPSEKCFRPDGHLFEGRCYEPDRNGGGYLERDALKTHDVIPWMFTDKGIDFALQQMDIAKRAETEDDTTEFDQDMAHLVSDFEPIPLSKGADNKTKGKIEIVIERRVIERYSSSKFWRKESFRGSLVEETDNSMEISTDETIVQKRLRRRCVRTRPYRADESAYAKVIFSYHSIQKLQVLGLARRDGTPIARIAAVPTAGPSSGIKRLGAEESSDEGSASDSTSNSSVPRHRKRRGAISGLGGECSGVRKVQNTQHPWGGAHEQDKAEALQTVLNSSALLESHPVWDSIFEGQANAAGTHLAIQPAFQRPSANKHQLQHYNAAPGGGLEEQLVAQSSSKMVTMAEEDGTGEGIE